jgi:hypothetical protein
LLRRISGDAFGIMAISHKYRVIFIHIPKNAGCSIEESFEIAHRDFRTENREILQGWIHSEDLKSHGFLSPTLQHLTANDLRKILPDETFNSYFKFAIVRNPWDRMVSQYLFHRKFYHLIAKKEADEDLSFDEFLRNLNSFVMQEQFEFVTDDNGESLVDFIGRFENLENDFKIICKRIGISERLLPHTNTTKHTHYSRYYTEETKELVQQLFPTDIEIFGYQFERMKWIDTKRFNLLSLGKKIRHRIYKI